MRSSITVAVALSAFAVFGCTEKAAPPDAEFKPGETPMQTQAGVGTAMHTGAGQAIGKPSTETAAAGSQPATSPNIATVGGSAAAARPASRGLGTIAAIQGNPMIVRATRPLDARIGSPLQTGDIIETGADTKVRINFEDGSELAIGPRSKVTLETYMLNGKTRTGSIRVAIGSFWMNISEWVIPEQSSIAIVTPNAIAGVRGTALWGDTQRGMICSLAGTVIVSSVSGKMSPASLAPGHCVGELDAVKLTPIQPDATTVQMYLDEVQIKQAR